MIAPGEAARLADLIEAARSYKMTPAERREQRVSFIWGQMGHKSGLSKEDIRRIMAEHGF